MNVNFPTLSALYDPPSYLGDRLKDDDYGHAIITFGHAQVARIPLDVHNTYDQEAQELAVEGAVARWLAR